MQEYSIQRFHLDRTCGKSASAAATGTAAWPATNRRLGGQLSRDNRRFLTDLSGFSLSIEAF